jgi:hypothetical protein
VIRVTYQYSHINTKDEEAVGPRPMSPDFFPTGDWEGRTRQDLYEANITRTWGMSSMTFGRQVVDRDWLVGSNNWGEVGRAWTGLYIQNGRNDYFVGRLDLDTIGEHRFGSDQHLAFMGQDWRLGKTSLYYKLDRRGESVYTLGHVWGMENGNTSFNIKGAWQWGQVGGQDLEAWAAVAKAKLNVSNRINLFASYSTASGGDASDGKVNTFDDLYPSDHHRLGMMDMVALRNVQALSVGLGFDVSEDIGLKLSYHNFSLFDENDNWYQTSYIANNYGSLAGNGSTNLGSEIDVSLHWRLNEALKISGGFGIFDPGTAINNVGGANDNSTYMYVGVGFRY